MNRYASRYRYITEQAAYRRSVESRGLAALLAPYTIRAARLPQQRRAVPANRSFHAV